MNYYYFWFLFILLIGVFNYLIGFYMLIFDYMIIMDWDLLNLNSGYMVFTLVFDYFSLLFMGSVMVISSMVILYSNSYMASDLNKIRFLFLLLLFIMSMCFMIMSPNLVSILLGWDGLGLVSYCLVIYYNNNSSYNSGMITILTNRIGDVAILLGIGLMSMSGSWYFMYFFFYEMFYSKYLILLLVAAAFTKSAQVPFSSWLPAAMAAPTPVSALVHSSTLVTAGVYLMIRFKEFLGFYITDFFLFISVLTMFMSGLVANYEFDLKKIIALSTLSQLGLMMSVFFMGFYDVSFFHLLTHAFFKALLFLCAGLFIHGVNGTQDIRYMGSFVINFPYTMSCFAIANFSLCGLPFLSGFYSKDLIVELMIMDWNNLFLCLLFFTSIGLTACYSIRLCYYCMFGNEGIISFNLYSEDKDMTFSMLILVFMGVVGGSFLSWLIFPYPTFICMPLILSIMSILFIIIGGWVGYEFSLSYFSFNIFWLKNLIVYYFFINMWFLPNFSTYIIYNKFYYISLNYVSIFDYGWGEHLVSSGLVLYFLFLSKLNYILQFNSLKIYFMIFLFMTFMFFII
uniref:NADH dehydrogenase subunit 5 n=1 Tax=Cavelerius yunnanensis TaxID=2969358 RepID=UPI002176DEBD|nr:NADH dehydrogenase subunit 5 [Cavelerius yunnanensis]UUJ37745.1 NADH dehydrogenase subunit 5 [Cavelerius yunnanensis]